MSKPIDTELPEVLPAARRRDAELMTTDDRRAISGFAGALDALKSAGVVVVDAADFGDGFTVLDTKDKHTLQGVGFVILEWRFSEGDNGAFVSFSLVTEDGRKLVLNDGSTGIMAQLLDITRERTAAKHKHPQAGLLVSKGLRVSTYDRRDGNGDKIVNPATGKPERATTVYLAI